MSSAQSESPEQSVLPPSHPIAARTFPFLCEVCKSRDATTCSACKSVSYCGRECQRKNWATHKRVCKVFQQLHRNGPFLDSAKFVGDSNSTTPLEMMFGRQLFISSYAGSEPNQFESEQLNRFPRCNVCGKSAVCQASKGGAAPLRGLTPCSVCRCVAYCTQECAEADPYHTAGGELCRKFAGTTEALRVVLEQKGHRMGYCSKFGSTCDLLRCGAATLRKTVDHSASSQLRKTCRRRFSCRRKRRPCSSFYQRIMGMGTTSTPGVAEEEGEVVAEDEEDEQGPPPPAHMLPWIAYAHAVDFGIGTTDLPLLGMVDGFRCFGRSVAAVVRSLRCRAAGKEIFRYNLFRRRCHPRDWRRG